MKKWIQQLWMMICVAFAVMCVPHFVCATGNDTGVMTSGLALRNNVQERSYKAGSGTIHWVPGTVDEEGNMITPAVLTLNNATITNDFYAIHVMTDTDLKIELIGTNTIRTTGDDAIWITTEKPTKDIAVSFEGTGSLSVEAVKRSISIYGKMIIDGATIQAPMGNDGNVNQISADGIEIEDGELDCNLIVMGDTLHVKKGSVRAGGVMVKNVVLDQEATLDVYTLCMSDNTGIQGSGKLNGFYYYAEEDNYAYMIGMIVIDDDWEAIFRQSSTLGDVKVELCEGTKVTVPKGYEMDLSGVELIMDDNASLSVEGTLKLKEGTTAEQVKKLNLTGEGVAIVSGKAYTAGGAELSVIANIDIVKLDNGNIPFANHGILWDPDTKTLTLNGVYVTGSLNLPQGSTIVLHGENRVMGEIQVEGKASAAFAYYGDGTLSGGGKQYVSHTYNEPVFVWTQTADGYVVKVELVCKECNEKEVLDAKVKVTATEATYETEGKLVYEAKVIIQGKEYTGTKEVVIPRKDMTGLQITDEKSGAIYKVTTTTATGGTVEYVKHTKKSAKKVTIPKIIKIYGNTYKVTSIAKKAFKGRGKLTTVKIGDNVKVIGKEAFSGCKKLQSVKLGKNVTTIGDKAFYKCRKLSAVTIPSKVNKIGKSAFEGCKCLRKITIKTTKLTSKKVGAKAFKGIKSNATIKVPKSKMKTYKSILKNKGVGKKVHFKKK